MYRNTPHPNPLPQGERKSGKSGRRDTYTTGIPPYKSNLVGSGDPSFDVRGRETGAQQSPLRRIGGASKTAFLPNEAICNVRIFEWKCHEIKELTHITQF